MTEFFSDFSHFFTAAGALALLKIIIIDIVMSGDNAIVIGIATKSLSPELRKKAIFWGIIGAALLRIIFAFIAVWLLTVPGLHFVGGLLLAYVVWGFYKDLRHPHDHSTDVQSISEDNKTSSTGLKKAIIAILIADVSMSLDNVLAVASAADGHYVSLAIGLIIAILLMAFAANYIAKLIGKYPIIGWIGFVVLAYVTGKMLYVGVIELIEIFG